MCRRRIQPLRVFHSTVVPATDQPDRTRFHPSLAVKKALAYLAGVHKTVNRPMVTIIGRFFVLCTGAGAPKAPLCKRSLGCSAKSYSTHYTGRRIEVRPLSVQQIGIG